MGSLLLRKLIVTVTVAVLGLAGQLLHAENEPAQEKLSIIDGYYPAYPPTAPATGEQQNLIQRGEYLSKMGDCISCHTNVKAGTPAYAGGLPIETPFGTFYSPNITPDKETGIGNWTEKDFIRALKEGRDPKGRNYFPVFPYIYFSKITDEDARALYAYFMSLPPVNLPNKSLPFPFNVPGSRFTLWGWNLLFFFPEGHGFQYEKGRSSEWNRGKYIVDSLGHCSMCHTPLNPFGAPKNKYYLTGGFIDGYWAPNITKYGLESGTHQEVTDVFKFNKLLNNAGPVAGPMAEVNHNSLMYLTDADRMAIATYLKTVVSEEPLGLPASNDPPSLERGKQVYFTACVICHQDGAMSAPLLGSSASWYERLKSSGLTGLYSHAIDGYNFMPIKGACVTCSDNDIISAIDYILNESLTRTQLLNLKSGGAAKFPVSGETVYNEHCAACHNDGKQGAPKIGDQEAWKSLIAKNMDVLIENTVHGKDHPKNGGCNQCTTNEVIEAVKYIVSKSKTEGNYSLW
ncbi:c-type cytochrome [Fluoribacter gormanii]|uniref:Cytochrome c5 n=1 Tax=Fluoribacter gormanii TaxID=464 RepID=A0A377GES4_9GAMM|nr:c-type cytochrome [Fluoribacter gormanii]KTD01712.1 cytochrome c [Fluoribacter gormanii]MCW8445124.1 c-type cytochrome [Fluoribacter gormanii]MCW8470334.1 c-type cytochrome [Fluoribacter gormanii]SIR79571.1 Cytochrome c5 [Fluoribacter gormanii]STO23306.1 Gluconate 2-dehydrogenase cytochrome c subunit precursor [Fluoribacter gormanii]